MEFMKNLSGNIAGGINNCMMAKIESFDATTMKADVIPLVRIRNKEGNIENGSMLIEVPVSFLKAGPFLIRPPYKPGDIVVVLFADSDIENVLLSGDISNPNSTRKHSLDDAIVIGSIMPYTISLPSDHKNDLVIAKNDFSSKIVIKEDGGIDIISNEVITLESDKGINIKGPSNSESW